MDQTMKWGNVSSFTRIRWTIEWARRIYADTDTSVDINTLWPRKMATSGMSLWNTWPGSPQLALHCNSNNTVMVGRLYCFRTCNKRI